MKVDPDVLRAFAGFVDSAADKIGDSTPGSSVDSLLTAFPGTAFGSVADRGRDISEGARQRMALLADGFGRL
ncbi:hypothetical protein SAMN05444695_1233 [Rhodococcus triatomae]|uniref:Uncharacterized protein n=1 Tax=Rhodococcus triatomae TaxID=300028 RepID=A0A1G8SNI7_9NOCA|nr:hypothetical protein SAMN05444695_1233 [Rhodococcus triatomae]